MRARVVVVIALTHVASCMPSPKSTVMDAGTIVIDAGTIVIDARTIIDAVTIVDAGATQREPPFSVNAKTHCVAKATARVHARPGGAGNVGFAQGCPSWVDRRVLPARANGGIGALEHAVTSTEQRGGSDVCCYFGAPPPP